MMYLGFLLTTVTLFCAGVVTTAAFTLMMGLSQKAPAGMQVRLHSILTPLSPPPQKKRRFN